MVVLFALLSCVGFVAIIIGWRHLFGTTRDREITWRAATLIAAVSVTLQFIVFVAFEAYSMSIGGFAKDYRAFFLWGRISLGLFLITLLCVVLARNRSVLGILVGSVALETAWWLLAMGE